MENLIKAAGNAAGQAIVAAVPIIVGAAVAEPVLLGALTGAAILAVGIGATTAFFLVWGTTR